MAITLDTITLPLDLVWVDEYQWTPIQQKSEYTLTGAHLVQTGAKQAGRPVTLAGGAEHGWATKAEVDALVAKLGVAAMTLTLHDGRQFSVLWRHEQTPIEAHPVVDLANPGADDLYALSLRFLIL